MPLAKIFDIITDSLLRVVSATYGNAHTEAAENHVSLLMTTSQIIAEKHLAAYIYLRAESEKEPTNYTLMRMCINHAAEISRYADFDGFLSDKPDVRDEIYADCERKNACISRYCEDKANVEKSDYAMAWIYIHTKQFDKAKALIDRLPSLESRSLREHIMTQFVLFQFGFEREKEIITENISKLMFTTAHEFFYSFEDYAWSSEPDKSIEMSHKMLGVLEAYKAFDGMLSDVLWEELRICKFLPKCYATKGDVESAGKELVTIAENFSKTAHSDIFADIDEAKSETAELINEAVGIVDENIVSSCAHLKTMQRQCRKLSEWSDSINRILCSTGALIGRPNGRDYTLLNECVKRIECDGFELMMYGDWYDKIDEIAVFLTDISKPFPAFHVEKSVGDLISRNGQGDTKKALELFEMNCVLAQSKPPLK